MSDAYVTPETRAGPDSEQLLSRQCPEQEGLQHGGSLTAEGGMGPHLSPPGKEAGEVEG